MTTYPSSSNPCQDIPAIDGDPLELLDPPEPGPLLERAVLGPALFDDVPADGCDVASITEVAESTSTAAMPTAVIAPHHSRAARPRADQRSLTRHLRRFMCPSLQTPRRQRQRKMSSGDKVGMRKL